jgi:NAD/NADP transhydrogenase alpha subunit
VHNINVVIETTALIPRKVEPHLIGNIIEFNLKFGLEVIDVMIERDRRDERPKDNRGTW